MHLPSTWTQLTSCPSLILFAILMLLSRLIHIEHIFTFNNAPRVVPNSRFSLQGASKQTLMLLLVIKLKPLKVVCHTFFSEKIYFKYDDELWRVQYCWQWVDIALWCSVQHLSFEPGRNSMRFQCRHCVRQWVCVWCETCFQLYVSWVIDIL